MATIVMSVLHFLYGGPVFGMPRFCDVPRSKLHGTDFGFMIFHL